MARSFNGTSSDHIITASYTAPVATSLCAFVNPSTLTNAYNGIVGQKQGGSNYLNVFVKSTGKMAYYVFAGGPVFVDPGSAAISGWTHVALTYASTGGLNTYVNGANDGTAAANGNITTINAGFSIGYDNTTSSRDFPGSIAEVAQWNVKLTGDEIISLAKGFSPLLIRPASLINYFPLVGRISPELELKNGRSGTVSGTTVSAHPRIIYPKRWLASA